MPKTAYENVWLKYRQRVEEARKTKRSKFHSNSDEAHEVVVLTDEEKKVIEANNIHMLKILRGNIDPVSELEKRIKDVVFHSAKPQSP